MEIAMQSENRRFPASIGNPLESAIAAPMRGNGVTLSAKAEGVHAEPARRRFR